MCMSSNSIIYFPSRQLESVIYAFKYCYKDHFHVFAGTVIGVVIYTGKETRSVMNTSNPKNKVG